ncbi:MAG: CBS domain-containing protein [Anaerolineae bacterium]|nr:CBS domain-containing protein [Anaerolineae bacterium]
MITPPHAIILTHEHADFDALASLLAAARLHPHAIPVLPHQLNRNLEAFLAVYRDVLPFQRSEDLPRRRVEHVILVDTQTVQHVRGMGPSPTATGLIIDHHPLMRELPPGWNFIGEEVGATTTLLVEMLAKQGSALNVTEATLLLLGIYEDTGGLYYETTTARDLRAAAWLLEQGANQRIVHRFLHHPLTEEQRALYQQLADNVLAYQFQGHSVIIAHATVSETIEEISTLAHKLHDLYEPDAVFMLVQMGDNIQLVARSTSDAIDVGKIASALGGGGHSRAAAALMHGGSLASALETLVYLLQTHVRPPVTVGQIMSYGAPQTLAPDDTIATAAERMQRYGFEGFPVVENGRIVGMLTRREIDRAMHHGLQRHPVSRYMRRGEVYVTPEDSIETLRQIMTEQDWGQVPVLDGRTGALLGIVTRTDLLRQWAGMAPARAESLERQMAAALPAGLLDLMKLAGALAAELGYPLYAVGGFVRDLLMGQPNLDLDLVVEGDAIALAHELARRFGGRVRSHRRFGTAKWILPEDRRGFVEANGLPATLDFATARTEFYERPTALPTVERSSIKLDLHRRDFTINTLAICLTPARWGELLDFYNGRKDLEEGIIRVLHSLSFVEDPTRILRAVRFEQRFGFRIEPRTAELIGNALDLLGRVSAERIRHELELLLAEAEPERAFCRLAELGVLPVLHPDLRCDGWLQARAAELRRQLAELAAPADEAAPAMAIPADHLPMLYCALLTYRMPEASVRDLLEKYRFRKAYRDLVEEAVRLRARLPELDRNGLKPSEVVAILDETSDEVRLLLRVVTDAWLVRQYLDQYQRRWRHVRPELTGDDLRRLGLPPGRIYSQILNRLRAARLDGAISTRAEEEQLVQEMLAAVHE